MVTRAKLTLIVYILILNICGGQASAQDGSRLIAELVGFDAEIDNPYFPLIPGTTFIYEKTNEEGTERTEVTVLHDIEQILGIPCRVVRDTSWLNGELIDDTLDWFAQDREGSVWFMGQAARSYENGMMVSSEGSWEAGVNGAQPGLIMLGDPDVGDTYHQEYYPNLAEDMAAVVSLTESTTVAYGSFENVLMTDEWTPLEPDVLEHKYYVSGVGLILEGEDEEDGNWDTEPVELIDIIVRSSLAENDSDGRSAVSDEMLAGTPVISGVQALEVAEGFLDGGTARRMELEYDGDRLMYAIEVGVNQLMVDAINGDILGVA
ncbi:MAG: hypothetical protein H7175_25140 [Burkholderiales bacterium]|nr:hypothetical protein [Anaerolineae bacterium]